ncbi:uncharacterized protein LOC110713293 [Chenopodium quinoa]|uniref:uncharacterized protein LOC110713293 n=1 Tax=Chenopodium quinoa TaxID=63459 RepID=UPI000B791F3B|nr:uncharacterized protein LOC110713293 [Chenopodium quinoa]
MKDHVSPSSLPSQGLDPKRPVNAIVTRSGKVLEESLPRKSETKEVSKEVLVEDERDGASLSEVVIETPREVRVEKEILKPKLPYPQKFMRHKLEEQFGRFIDMLKQLHLSLPYTEVVTQMPNYAKFLKDILSGASVSLMPYSVYQRVELWELLPFKITLQLVDSSIKIPKGKVEDVPLRVGKFVILVDVVVLEMDEHATIPIILVRPFLDTSGVMIDVKSAKISLKVGDEVIEFDLNESMKYSCSSLEYYMLIDSIDHVVSSMHEHLLTSNDPLENVLLNKKR